MFTSASVWDSGSEDVGRALWHPQALMPDVATNRLVITEGVGAWVTTSANQKLLDATAGLWYANIGHGRERLARAAFDQMRRLETYHLFGRFANEPALRLADRLAAIAPMPDARVMFTSGGSDSIDLACKLARRFWQLRGETDRRVMLSRHHAYHGLHGFGTSITGLDFNRAGYGTASLVPETARVSFNDLAEVERQILDIGPTSIAAVIAEPVMGTGGVHVPPPDYLVGLQQLAKRYGFLLIADEVITGFGRAGHMFASTRYGILPDLVTFAKGVTSGYAPLGGVLVGAEVSQPFFKPHSGHQAAIFRHGITYSGHATACVCAEENLNVLEEEDLISRSAALEKLLCEELASLRNHPLVKEIRDGGAFMAGVQLVDEVRAETVAQTCIELGVIIRPIHLNTLQISPPFVVTNTEVQLIVRTIAEALDQCVAHVRPAALAKSQQRNGDD